MLLEVTFSSLLTTWNVGQKTRSGCRGLKMRGKWGGFLWTPNMMGALVNDQLLLIPHRQYLQNNLLHIFDAIVRCNSQSLVLVPLHKLLASINIDNIYSSHT